MDPRVKTVILDRDLLPVLPQVDATEILEKHFEPIVIRVLQRLHPSCHVFVFKPVVVNEGGRWQPDLAMVDKSMGYWFVIEVETASHLLHQHILPQVKALRDGEYGSDAVKLLAKNLDISEGRATTLIQCLPRYVCVIANADNKEWEQALAAENIQFVSMATYQDRQGQTAHIVTGVLKPGERSLGFGIVRVTMDAIQISAPAQWKATTYRVIDSTGESNWECYFHEGRAWLTKKKGLLTMEDGKPVQFILLDNGSILLRTFI